ncbi:MAG: SDR family oxidoreductase [Bacteroidota bacterium]
MYNPFTLERKTIFVTGASSGIGRSTAIECSRMGAMLIISGRDHERLNETFEMLDGDKSRHTQLTADLSIQDEITRLVEELPSLDGIVHCAGYTKTLPFQFVNKDDLTAIMQVNFMAPTLITQSLVKKKKLNKDASIVFISSVSGVFCTAVAGSLYSASKGAVNGVVKAMAVDLASKGIRVNSVNPGMIDTAIFSKGVITQDQLEEDTKKYPLKRYGKPAEVAFAAIYLLSDTSKWITGTNLLIDGGLTLL